MKKLKLGLKSGIGESQVKDRLKYDVDIYELHLNEDDLFGNKLKDLEDTIVNLQEKGIKVYLHQPMKIGDKYVHINKTNCNEEDYLNLTTRILVSLCKKYNIKCVVHINYGTLQDEVIEEETFSIKEDYIKTVYNIISFLDRFDKEREYLLFENGILGVGSYRKDFYLANLIKDTNIPLCMDISHLGISLDVSHDELNDYIENTLEILKNNIAYYHVVDTSAVNIHDGLSLGEGRVDWKRIQDYILNCDYIYEIALTDFNDCTPMINSHNYLKSVCND